jgi:hypothetical protein
MGLQFFHVKDLGRMIDVIFRKTSVLYAKRVIGSNYRFGRWIYYNYLKE